MAHTHASERRQETSLALDAKHPKEAQPPCLPTAAIGRQLPVLQPRLPSAADLLPYLTAIDERRWYANYGPLVMQLEQRLGDRFGVEAGEILTTANGTLGLVAALVARNIPSGSLCVMPSWTFAATPHAALAAGLTPWFHDVDPRTWALDPDAVEETLRRTASPAKSVIVVSPFGAPVDMEAWQLFEDRTGLSVIVDAAAGFDSARAGRIPSLVSLHATKILGAGEGGFLISTDQSLLERARAWCNFGFAGSRSARVPASNAKMSEYHAAVALAGLDVWSATRARHAQIAEWYCRAIGRLDSVTLQPGYGKRWVTGTTSVLLPSRSAAHVPHALQQLGIETKTWWGQGCHVQPAFADCPRGDLSLTHALGQRVLGLPHFPDMQKSDVDAVVGALAQVLVAREPLRRRPA